MARRDARPELAIVGNEEEAPPPGPIVDPDAQPVVDPFVDHPNRSHYPITPNRPDAWGTPSVSEPGQ